MNDLQLTVKDAAIELNRLHGEIEGKMRSTVSDAIRAGEILANVKEKLGHGEFLPWIKANCKFSQQSASNYMRLFEYRSKLPTVGNLQEAYKQVETLEAQAKKSEEQRARERVETFNKTGEKPEGWRRGTDDKLAVEEAERKARIKKVQEELKKEPERPKETPFLGSDEIKKLAEAAMAQTIKRMEFKDRIRVSSQSDQFVEALLDYLEDLDDDNRRIEACYNIIKVCKGIANQLQVEAAKK